MKNSLHEVSNQQVVKYLVLDRGHQRVPRRFERNAAIKPSLLEFDDVVLPPCSDIDKIETLLEVRDRTEIVCHSGHIVLFELISPIVTEIFRGKLLGWRFSGTNLGIAIIIASITNIGGKKFRGI